MSASTSPSSPNPPLTPPPVTESASERKLPPQAPAPSLPRVGDLAGQEVDFDEARYTLGRLLGVGGMGEVYLARRVVDTRDVQWNTADQAAIKVVRRDLAAYFGADVKPFADEARLHWHLSHPNVVAVRGITEADGTLYVLMEYLEGYDLRMLLKVAEGLGKRLSEGAICNILAQVADALDYVHRATDESGKPLHIVHRDVSPSNIRVTASGVVKLMDFGLAMHDADWREQTRSSWSGFKGKAPYLSPEQAGRQVLDGRADFFALGCVLVECLIGRRLFDGDHEAIVLSAIQSFSPEDVEKALQGVEEGMKAICRKLLARYREERYRTGKEVAEALRSWAFGQKRYMLDSGTLAREVAEFMAPEGEEDTPPPPEPQASSQGWREPARRRPLHIAVAALMLVGFSVALVLAAVYLLRPRPPPAPPVERNLMPAPSASPPPSPETPVLEEAKPIAPEKKAQSSVAKCVGVTLAGALAAGCPPVHVVTHSRAGDCTMQEAPRKIAGHQIPEFFPVQFVSLNGQKCTGQPPRPGWTCKTDPACCAPSLPICSKEPCPAGDGELVMMSRDDDRLEVPVPEQFFQEALFYGEAHIEPEPAVLKEAGVDKPRSFTGRTVSRFTEMRLKDGTTVPICGVLYQGYFESKGGLEYHEKPPGVHKEGLPVLDPQYFGGPATPDAIPLIQLFWP